VILLKRRAPAVKSLAAPQLVALTEGINISLEKPIILIGRHQECDIQIPSRKISRRHCCIALVADHLVIRDLGSTNGIRINGVKVVEGNLRPNDELTIGNMRYQFRWGIDAEPASGSSAKNGIKVSKQNLTMKPNSEESFDEPMPLPEAALAHPVLQGKPANSNDPKPGSLEIPDRVDLH
jgi:pSer/pThr/pTyr-binding forkhead associated (FHA) protein